MPYLKYLNDEKLNVARGLVRDAEVRNIFGFNIELGATYRPLWEVASTYTYPTSNTAMGIKSTVGGDSCTIRVIGLDSNYDIISENVSVSGTSNTSLSTSFYRINDMITIAGTTPTGTVTLTGGSTIYGQINPNTGRNQASIFTVPRGYKFYLNRLSAFCATASLNNRTLFFRNRVISPQGVEFNVAETTFLEQMNIDRQYPFVYDEKYDIQLQGKASAGTQEYGVFGEGVLINESGIGLR
jgi:hypothetical protein